MTRLGRGAMRAVYVLLVNLVVMISCSSQEPRPLNNAEVGEQIYSAIKAGDYDQAIRIGEDALKAQPSNGFVLWQVGLVYLSRAAVDSQGREKWLDLATQYADKILGSDSPDELNYFNAIRIYEVAGDLQSEKPCSFYSRSSELYKRLAAGLDGRTGRSPEDQRASDTIRKNARAGAERVTGKAAAAGCQLRGA